MPQITDRFGPIPSQTILDASGSGTIGFQPNGKNARITTLFVKVSTSVKQATVTIYKGQVADSNIVGSTNSGSTGAPAFGNIDLFDGETLYVVWTGGDVGSTATATFVGQAINFSDVGGSELRWSDPIAAADGSLIFPAIKSPNFVSGSMGWSLDRNGNIELNNAVIRGELDVVSTVGNSYIHIFNSIGTAIIQMKPDDTAAGTYAQFGFIAPSSTNLPGNHYGELDIGPPGFGSAGFLALTGDSAEGAKSYANFYRIDVRKNNVDLGGGFIDFNKAVTTTGPSTATTDTTVQTLTENFGVMAASRQFKASFTGTVASTVAGDRIGFRAFVNATQIVDYGQVTIDTANVGQPFHFDVGFTGVAGATITFTARRVAGTGSWTVGTRYGELVDIKAT